MFLSCVFHVTHVAMDVKLFLQIKALEMLDRGFHHPALSGPHSRSVAAGSWCPGPALGASALCTLSKRTTEIQLARAGPGQAWQTLALEIRKGRCMQPVSLSNASENETLGVLLETCLHYVSALVILISVYMVGISVLQTEAAYTNDHFHTLQWGNKNALPVFLQKKLLSRATCGWYKWLPLCFDDRGWTCWTSRFWCVFLGLHPLSSWQTLGTSKLVSTSSISRRGSRALELGLENIFVDVKWVTCRHHSCVQGN